MDYRAKFGMAAAIVVAVVASSIAGISPSGAGPATGSDPAVLRIGYFPNINHAQAVIGIGSGDFQHSLDGIKVETRVFTAGPSVIEALFANQIDVAYVGPNPTINGYVKSDGEALRIVSGAASGGVVFVVRNGAGIESSEDLADKKFSAPGHGNTQDVALRKYLLENGFKTAEGGTVMVLPSTNAEIVTLMVRQDIHGAWVPEPWGAKLVAEADAKVLVDERDLWPDGQFVSAHIIVRTDYLASNPETIKNLLRAHVDQTIRIRENPDQAVAAFNEELKRLTGRTIPEEHLKAALSRMELTWNPMQESLFQSADDAYEIGFFDERPDLSGIYDLDILNEVLREKGLPEVQ